MSRTRASRLDIWRGDTLRERIDELGDISGRDDLCFTVKKFSHDPDSESQIKVCEIGGLLYIDGGAAATPAHGSIVIVDAVNGKIDVVVAAEEIAKLSNDWLGYHDVQIITGAIVDTRRHGNAQVVGDTTRATS